MIGAFFKNRTVSDWLGRVLGVLGGAGYADAPPVTLEPGDVLLTVSGPVIDLLKAERVALNLLQHLSGIATHTARFVEKYPIEHDYAGKKEDYVGRAEALVGLERLDAHAASLGRFGAWVEPA